MKSLKKISWIIGEVVIGSLITIALAIFEVFDKKAGKYDAIKTLKDGFHLVVTTPRYRWREHRHGLEKPRY